ncbi:hypothetical protein THDSLph1_CDS0031 [Terrisporobacter phage TPDSL_ph1]
MCFLKIMYGKCSVHMNSMSNKLLIDLFPTTRTG